jgi:site-specific recombinase XerD
MILFARYMPKYKKDWWEQAKQFQTSLLSEQNLREMLEKCKDNEEKVCLILLYYTGARPSEILALKAKDIWQDGKKIAISIPTLKKGLGRTIFIPLNDITQKLIEFVKNRPQDIKLILKWKNCGNIRDFIYRVSDKKLTPYFFRHNRISQLANAGVDPYTLKRFKGAKSLSSVEPYLQLAGVGMKRIAHKIK